MANSTTLSAGVSAANGQSILGALAARVADFFTYRKAVNDLHDMDDHLLQDIGISRAEIELFAKGAARRW